MVNSSKGRRYGKILRWSRRYVPKPNAAVPAIVFPCGCSRSMWGLLLGGLTCVCCGGGCVFLARSLRGKIETSNFLGDTALRLGFGTMAVRPLRAGSQIGKGAASVCRFHPVVPYSGGAGDRTNRQTQLAFDHGTPCWRVFAQVGCQLFFSISSQHGCAIKRDC